MNLRDEQFVLLRRLQILTGVVPVGLFLVFHFLVNGQATAGRAAYTSAVTAIARVPALPVVESVLIGLPLLAHLALGVVLGMSRQGAFEPPFPGARARAVQRASGFYLGMYVVIHVWSLRLAPERVSGQVALFDLVASQLRNPAVLVLQSLAVVAAAVHFAVGLSSLANPRLFPVSVVVARRLRTGAAIFAALLALRGVSALLAFVSPAFQFLAPR